jgi:hypothetical protein
VGVTVADLLQNLGSALKEMKDELATDSNLDVLVEVLLILALADVLHGEAHLLSGSLDEEEEGLDIEVAHYLDAEDLVEKFDGLDLDVGAAPDNPGGLVGQQHSHKLRFDSSTHATKAASPSRRSSVSMTRATVLACSCDLNSYIWTELRLSCTQRAKCSKSSIENTPSNCLSHTNRTPRCRKSKG